MIEPWIPKSTVKLRYGDFCFIPRSDGGCALFVYLQRQGNARSYFYGGLGTAVLESPDMAMIPESIDIPEHALIHIQCFEKNQTPIVGNLAARLPNELPTKTKEAINNTGIGATSLVWGYKAIINRANALV